MPMEMPDMMRRGGKPSRACSGRARLDRIGSFVWGGLERAGLGGALKGVREAAVRASQRRRSTASLRGDDNLVYIEDARARMEAARREGRTSQVLFIAGHTHAHELVELGEGAVFANPGCWVRPGLGYAVLVDGLDVELIEVREPYWRM